ncbi:MAG: YwmB family TATA-box binding protein [Lachnospiraceae bacterium]|nr:YwmB family TATA-box binding protein [Lachnospiraceae bacterium]
MNKKTRIYIIVLIWAAAMLQLFINSAINREEKMIEQAMSESVSNIIESVVKAYSYYGNQEITQQGRELIVKNLANELGITSGYEIVTRKDGENITTALEKKGAYGDTSVKVISLCERDAHNQKIIENYIMVEICLKGSAASSAETYKEKLENMYTGLGMKPNTNVYLCSQRPGQLTEGEIQSETSAFLEEMDAISVERVEFDGVISIYGYSNGINEFVYQQNERVNVNIAFTYDEENDVTYIHRAIPFIDRSF